MKTIKIKNNNIVRQNKLETNNNIAKIRNKKLQKYRKLKINSLLEEMPLNLNCYLLNLKIDGVMKKYPEDFIVEEITPEGVVLEAGKDMDFKEENKHDWNGSFIHFTLEKINWNTMDAIRELARKTKTRRKNFGFAGTKDKFALTTQRVGCFGIKPEKLEEIKNSIKDITIRDIQKTNIKLRMGHLWGNKFTIKIRLNESDKYYDDISKYGEILENKNLDYILNYYGTQRFGTFRPITHIVGKFIYNRDFESAFYTYCGAPINETGKLKEARELVDNGEFEKALKLFPKKSHYNEMKMIRHYIKTGNYKECFKVLPPQLSSMFVNAYQSYLFNEMINIRYRDYSFDILDGDVVEEGAPTGNLLGSDTILSDGIQGDIEKYIIEKENLDLKKFKIEDYGNFPGTKRKLITKIYDFRSSIDEDNNIISISFKMERGDYATVVLREIILGI